MQSNPMTPEEPHLFFAEISLDISRGEHALALQRLAPSAPILRAPTFSPSFLHGLIKEQATSLRRLNS